MHDGVRGWTEQEMLTNTMVNIPCGVGHYKSTVWLLVGHQKMGREKPAGKPRAGSQCSFVTIPFGRRPSKGKKRSPKACAICSTGKRQTSTVMTNRLLVATKGSQPRPSPFNARRGRSARTKQIHVCFLYENNTYLVKFRAWLIV